MTENVHAEELTVPDTPAEEEENPLVVQQKMDELKLEIAACEALEREGKDRELTPEELARIECIPEHCNRIVTYTRILRRTNTGPARIKEAKAPKKTKAALSAEKVQALLMG